MLDLELRAEFDDHFVVEVGTIVCDNPFGDVVSTYEIMFDESSHDILGNRCKRGCFYPLGKIVNCHKDETMSVGSGGLISPIISIPHIANGQGAVKTFRGTRGTCTISFHGGPIVTCS